MKAQILKLLQLKQLYKRQACGEKYANALFTPKSNAPIGQDINTLIKNCSLCNRIKHCKAPHIGLINQNASLCFISEIPLVSESQAFVQNKSAIMLQNIISNVFKLPLSQVSILSLIKCDPLNPHFEKSELLSCKSYVLTQLQSLAPKLCVLLGDVVSEHILGSHLEHSRILWHNNRKFLVTYALNELVRNPSLKTQAHNDFLIAKGQL